MYAAGSANNPESNDCLWRCCSLLHILVSITSYPTYNASFHKVHRRAICTFSLNETINQTLIDLLLSLPLFLGI